MTEPRSRFAALLALFGCACMYACGGAAAPRDASPLRPGPPTKRALLIGINQYKHAGTPGSGVTNLAGCVNDAENMRAVLVGKYEFPNDADHMKVLKDDQATHAGIVSAIEQHLIAKTHSGDIVVIFFAGHGSQMKDTSGTRINGMDETIVPHDSRDPANQVFDVSGNELSALIDRLNAKTANVTVIFDSCHSGTLLQNPSILARAIRTGYPRVVPPDTRPPPPPAAPRAATATRGVGVRPSNAKWSFIGGARADELANEYDEGGRREGAMTHVLLNALRAAPAGATYRDVMDVVTGRVSEMFATQHPQLEGAGADVAVFGDTASLANAYVPAKPTPTGAELAAGEVLGVTVGSIYEVYPAATKAFPPGQGIAKVRVTQVDVSTSTATLQSGRTVPADARAVEREHKYDAPRVRVTILDEPSAPVLGAIRQALSPHRQVEVVADRSRSDLTLGVANGVLELRGLAARDPLFTAPATAASTQPAVDTVLEWAQWFNLRSLSNPSSPLKVRLEAAKAGGPGPQLLNELKDGDRVVFTITNNSFLDLYIALIDFSSDGSRTVVFPKNGQQVKLQASQAYPLPATRVFVPAGRNELSDTVKVFATTSFVNFHTLTSGAIAANFDTRGFDPLADLLAAAARGTARNFESVSLESWVTADRMFTVKR